MICLILPVIGEALLLTAALSADAFAAGVAYGGSKIKIPAASVLVISAVCSLVLAVSLISGSMVKEYIPEKLTSLLCFGILFFLGLIKLFDGIMKTVIRRYSGFNKQIKFSAFSIKFILALYADPEEADIDSSRTISPGEAFSIAAALSLDGLAVGFGAALGSMSIITVTACSLIVGAFAIVAGSRLGGKIAGKMPVNPAGLSGGLLIILACLKL